MKLALLLVLAAFSAQCSEVRIAADFRGDVPPRRAMRDIKFPCDLSNAAGLSFDFRIDSLSEFSMFTFHFKCDGKWVGVKFPALKEGGWHRVVVERPRTKDDRKDWSKVTAFRVSGWRGGTNHTYLTVRNIAVEPLVPKRKPSETELELLRAAVADTNRTALAQLAATPPPEGERRLIWAHHPTGIRGKGWEYSVKTLKKGGFTDLIANLARGSRAAYKSEVLGMASTAEGRDRLDECLAACRRHGVKLHVWNCCWRTGWGTTKEELAKFASEGRLIKSEYEGGKEWLCPTHPVNRKMLVDSMVELAKKGVDGVHFDYIRYPDGSYCFCDGCRARFEEKIGRKLTDWPKALNSDRMLQRQWREFRRDAITAPVREVAELLHREYPSVEVSAAVFTDPLADWDWMGQDWAFWCEKGFLDFVCPMTYENDLESFARKQRKHMAQVTSKVPRYPGIGLGVWPKDGLDVARFSEQVTFLRKFGMKGFSVFELSPRFDRIADTVGSALTKGGRLQEVSY